MTNSADWKANLTLAFASPILKFSVPTAETLNPTLVSEAEALRAKSPNVTRAKNRFGWHSDKDLMSRTEPGFVELSKIIRKCVLSAAKAVSPEFDHTAYRLVLEAWININPPNGYNTPHRHSGFMWSGCYYVAMPSVEEGPSGCIEFLSPVIVPGEYRVLNAPCYQERMTFRPNPGDMLLFPSYLAHWVYPNEADEERMTIAFNGTFLPK